MQDGYLEKLINEDIKKEKESNEDLGVKFTDWRNHTIYKNKELNKWTCRLCNSNFKERASHKKSMKHKMLYNDFEIKRYEYVRIQIIKREKERDEYIKQEKEKREMNMLNYYNKNKNN